jgi:cytochrome b subunit of formate dehydrogenase
MYYLRLSKKHPTFHKYDYTEKAEYWALIWGTIVMGVTGFILWFPTMVGDWAPVWLIKVSEIIHFYEAILATLAIIVWHWFFVIFRPSEYPMSFAWISGGVTLAKYKEHHKVHYKEVFMQLKQFTEGKIQESELKNFAQLFKKRLTDNKVDLKEFVQSELENDLELREWVEKQNSEEKE